MYRLRLAGDLDDAQAHALSRALPYAKLAGLARSARDRTRSLAGIVLACTALTQLLQRHVSAADLYFPPRGKPRLRGMGQSVSFSIAHSGPWVVAAAATADVGIDIEWLPQAPTLGAHGGSARSLDEWVRSEAEAKCLGLGLLQFLRHAQPPRLEGTPLDIPECIAWLASRGALPAFQVHDFEMRMLRQLAAA